tara:strand:+ start:2845 stop:3993 length:1149 start_codon:yes stop_codon:yes gene_type:complete
MKKKILFVTGTRADFGKLKSIIKLVKSNNKFNVYIAITGMHLLKEYGNTYIEVEKNFKKNIFKFKNQSIENNLEIILQNTVQKFSKLVKKIKPDLIVLHGDRVESLACALVGSLNHIRTAHIEGGEVSGNIDDTIRHAVTKLCHFHFVGNKTARLRVISMGEKASCVFQIGSADIDIMLSKNLKSINSVKKYYEISFKNYAILLWHPVTSELNKLRSNTNKLIDFVNSSPENFIVINSNNDPGTKIILNCYKKNLNKKKNKLFKSIRFENFLTLLKNAKYILGNSSTGIYEAPIFGVPAINIGSRQYKRSNIRAIKNLEIDDLNNLSINYFIDRYKKTKRKIYGNGKTAEKFVEVIKRKSFWRISTQKNFSDILRKSKNVKR